MELGSHVWHLCLLAFDFWASLCLLFHLECDWSSGSVWFCWFGLSTQTPVQTARINMGIAHPKVPHSTWEPLGKKKKTGQSKAMFQWQEKWPKNIHLYWHRIEKWTEVPLCPGLPPVINILGLIKLRLLLPQRDNPSWDQSALVIRAKLSTIWSKFWL